MPKTRNAFAFRRLIYGIELDSKASELAMQGKIKEAQELSDKSEDLLFSAFQAKTNEPYIANRVKGIEQSIRNCERDLERSKFLTKCLDRHDERLKRLLSYKNSKRISELQKKYLIVRENLQGYVKLVNDLLAWNKTVLQRAFREEFGNRLRVARRRKSYTQEAVAEKLGITKAAYCNYELGNREMPNYFIYKIADILNVSSDYLLGIEK